MSIKTVLFICGFLICAGGAPFVPVLGILGYVAHYSIGPERQWWAAPIQHWGIRYSFTLGALTALGILLNFKRLRYGKNFLVLQEKLILLLLGVVWLSTLINESTAEHMVAMSDHPSVKMAKMVIFTLMLTHVITTMKDLDRLFWVLILGAFVLGLQAYSAPRADFMQGRLNSVGGPDFREANVLGAYLAAMLPIIGVQFYRSKWIGKGICLLAGVFATNAIVLTRSRGTLLGIGAGILAAILLAPLKHRIKILVGLVIAVGGGLYLSDPQYRDRTVTIVQPEEERDTSAQSRIEIWRGGIRMLWDNPLGVGAGNFRQAIERYAPEHPDRDAHSTYIRCAGELGFLGITIFVGLAVNAIISLRRVIKRCGELLQAEQDQFAYTSYGLVVSLCTILGCSITMSQLYIEYLWWIMMLSVCLHRAMENVEASRAPTVKLAQATPN